MQQPGWDYLELCCRNWDVLGPTRSDDRNRPKYCPISCQNSSAQERHFLSQLVMQLLKSTGFCHYLSGMRIATSSGGAAVCPGMGGKHPWAAGHTTFLGTLEAVWSLRSIRMLFARQRELLEHQTCEGGQSGFVGWLLPSPGAAHGPVTRLATHATNLDKEEFN